LKLLKKELRIASICNGLARTSSAADYSHRESCASLFGKMKWCASSLVWINACF
jgi:hypothetical protein